MLQQMTTGASIEDVAGARIELEAVDRALALLPENHRSAIVLRDVYGLTLEQMAKELGISVVAAKVRLHRARKRLRDVVYGPAEAEAQP